MQTIKGPDDFARVFPVSRETLAKLELYADLLRHWQKTINLVAPSTLPDIWQRHIADSAQLIPLAPPEAHKCLDLGSGAGFPGLVMAIMLTDRGQNSGLTPPHYTLLESDTRKAAFLREVVRQTGLRRAEADLTAQAGVDIVVARIEIANNSR